MLIISVRSWENFTPSDIIFIIALTVKNYHGIFSSLNYAKLQKVDIYTQYQCIQDMFLLAVNNEYYITVSKQKFSLAVIIYIISLRKTSKMNI